MRLVAVLVAATHSDTMLALREHLVPMPPPAPSNHHSGARVGRAR